MGDTVAFQTNRVSTPPTDLEVAGIDRGSDGVYQRVVEGFPYVRHYYDANGYLIYRCVHSTPGTATSATDWIITKYTYNASGSMTIREQLSGSVDGRAALSWSV